MKKALLVAAALLTPLLVLGAGYVTQWGDTLQSIASSQGETVAQLATRNPNLIVKSGQNVALSVPTPPVTPPAVTPPPVTPPAGNTSQEIRYQAYTTAYMSGDNTPPGSTQIDLGGHSGNAGGTGTYNDPITLAVGHSITGGQDVGDYPYGTKWYVPNLRKYFTAADSCGDGNTPQNGPCHTGYQGHIWLDLYLGVGSGSASLSCEDKVTDIHTVIQNPSPLYLVVPGAVYGTGCKQYGDTIIIQ